MKPVYKIKTIAVGMALLCSVMGSAGLTLGRAQGPAFVGSPLNVAVPVQFDSGEDAKSACMEADVYYAETLVDPSRVTVSVEPLAGGSALAGVVRVTSSALINEPIVSLNLRAGCQQKLSKRYTLFADLATQVAESVARAPTRGEAALADVPRAADAREALGSAASPRASALPARATAAPTKAKAAAPVSTPLAQPSPAVAPRQARIPGSAGKPRLRLDPLDLLIDRNPVLRASSELLTLPQEDLAKRAEAAAQWRALNASPQELLREAAQAQQIESAIKSLYTVTTQNQKDLIDLAGQLKRAQSERYANALVYSLMALCLASLAALGWLWRRQRVARAPAWFSGLEDGESIMPQSQSQQQQQQQQPVAQPTPVSKVQPEPEPKPSQLIGRTEPAFAAPTLAGPAINVRKVDVDLDLDIDIDLDAPPSKAAGDLIAAPTRPVAAPSASRPAPASRPASASEPASGVRDFSVSISGGLRAIDSEELVDVRHQAEFFMSLGEHEKAIDALTGRIAQCGESSPLVCLDLLKIYHSLGRQPEFDFMRAEFNSWFAAHVPKFGDFGDEGRALELYPKVMERIAALWPDPRVLEYIEDCMYHHSGDADALVFDLEAYRDLLLLHGVAKRIVRLARGDDGDSAMSDLQRIPARAPKASVADSPGAPSSRAAAHRAGVQFRGSWQRDNPAAPDPQDAVDTRGSPLGAMKLPPVATPAERPSAAPRPSPSDSAGARLTDFNFLDLR